MTDRSVLESIKDGYKSDDFCIRLAQNGVPGAQLINNLWYIGDRLVIPRTGDICENLFRLAHDTLGHFGADKSYVMLIIGQICERTWKNHMSLHVLTANVTNPVLQNLLVLYIPYQSLTSVGIVWLWILLDLYPRTMATTASLL